jgi:hypothetical protein
MALDAWARAVRHAQTVERQWFRLNEALYVRDTTIAPFVIDYMSANQVVLVCQAAQEEAYFYVMACGRLAAAVERSGAFADIFSDQELATIRVLRNFWEHEDDYPLLGPVDPARVRGNTLKFLSGYGQSPALRSVVRRASPDGSYIISECLNVDTWRGKAQAVAESAPPKPESGAHAGA